MDDLKKQKGISSILHQALCIISKPTVNSNWSYSPETLNLCQNRRFFCLVWPWNLMDDINKNRAHPLYYVKPCTSFQNYGWIQTGVTIWKLSIWVKIGDFLSRLTLKFYRWPWKTIGHLFYATSSFVHRFKAIGELKLELQSGNGQFWSKSAFFVPCDLEIWQMTLKNNRAYLLCTRRKCKQDSVGVRWILVVPRDSGGASAGFCWCIWSEMADEVAAPCKSTATQGRAALRMR